MNDTAAPSPLVQREVLVHALYEAAELEHNLMCTYLYAALSLRDGESEGLSAHEEGQLATWLAEDPFNRSLFESAVTTLVPSLA